MNGKWEGRQLCYCLTEVFCETRQETYIGYGIALLHEGELLRRFDDVSTDRARMEQLVQRCNYAGLSPYHIGDVVEDLLC